MRLALICPYAWDRPGGVQSHVRSLAPALARRGHEVAVIAPASSRFEDEHEHGRGGSGDAADYSLHLVGRTISVPANGSVAPIAFGPRTASRLKEVLGRLAPQVIQAHEPLIPSLSLLAIRAGEAPVVGTFHAATEKSLGYRVARPYLKRVADGIVNKTAVSPAARALASRYFPGHYTIVPNGIDVARFADAEPLDFGSKRTVLFLGRVERRKGLEPLIQAMARLGDLDVRLAVVGDGPRVSSARRLAGRLRIDAVWFGRASEADVARAYRGADVYCAPNLGGESFGIVLLEALAAGTPVVCSALDAFKDVAGDAATFAPPGDVALLAAGLRTILTSGGNEDHIAAGRRTAARFDWGRLAQRLEEVFATAARERA